MSASYIEVTDAPGVMGGKVLGRAVWRFWVCFPVLYLEAYELQERATSRHKWRTVGAYWRLPSNRLDLRRSIRLEAVPLPDWVRELAVNKAANQLVVKVWEGR